MACTLRVMVLFHRSPVFSHWAGKFWVPDGMGDRIMAPNDVHTLFPGNMSRYMAKETLQM